jgi:hypothetical protein
MVFNNVLLCTLETSKQYFPCPFLYYPRITKEQSMALFGFFSVGTKV